jgi:hypothetical protein
MSKATDGFAIEIKRDTDLGSAMLIARDEAGNNQPVGTACSVAEASEMAVEHHEASKLDKAAFQPVRYELWARGLQGVYRDVLAAGVKLYAR